MSESTEYSREAIAKVARRIRDNAQRNGHTMTTRESEERVRKAIRNSPTTNPK
jgi:uncharacterized protein YoaH (UPF0181 family)